MATLRGRATAVTSLVLVFVVALTMTSASGAHARAKKYKVDRSYSETYAPAKRTLGAPIAKRRCGLRDKGCFQAFVRGSIHSSKSTKPRAVSGSFYVKWKKLKCERGFLGYPTSGDLRIKGGTRQNFQGGYLTWTRKSGVRSFKYVRAKSPVKPAPKASNPSPKATPSSRPKTTPNVPAVKSDYLKKGSMDVTASTQKAFFDKYASIRKQNGYVAVPSNRFITGHENYVRYGASSLDDYGMQCIRATELYRDQGIAAGHVNGQCNSNVNAYTASSSIPAGDRYASLWWGSMGHRGVIYDLPNEKFWEPNSGNPNGLCLTYRASLAWDGWTDPIDEFYYGRAVASWVVCPTPR